MKTIKEKVIEKWEEKHKANLGFKGGWDANDIFDYLKETIDETLKEVLELIDEWAKKTGYREDDTFFEDVEELKSKIEGK